MSSTTLILTGTRGAGKTTLARYLEDAGRFRVVGAVTTRPPRRDDTEGTYDYLARDAFLAEAAQGRFVIQTHYGPHLYAIRQSDMEVAFSVDASPILILTPESTHRYLSAAHKQTPLGIFLDAPDYVLDERLMLRDGIPPAATLAQRIADREHNYPPLVHIQSTLSIHVVAARATELLAGP